MNFVSTNYKTAYASVNFFDNTQKEIGRVVVFTPFHADCKIIIKDFWLLINKIFLASILSNNVSNVITVNFVPSQFLLSSSKIY